MKALIAMSGGVDSSVAAYLTSQEGYECTGCTMRLYDEESTCCSVNDVEDARSVANRLSMDYYVFNMTEAFKEKVIDSFCDCYMKGITPNPCIECNCHIKFNALLKKAESLGMDKIVTGHYALIEEKGGVFYLKMASDPLKDQSYVLYRMTQKELSKTLFPLGGMPKEETRKIALEHGFINAHKKDSQDICFVPDGDYASVIERYKGYVSTPGDFVRRDGTVIGKHKGIIHYTVGQRRGLGIAYTESLYVLQIKPESNEVVLGTVDELFTDRLSAHNSSFTLPQIPKKGDRVSVRVRYHAPLVEATIEDISDDCFTLLFDKPQRAVTPGQAAVLYDNDIVLGGGIID